VNPGKLFRNIQCLRHFAATCAPPVLHGVQGVAGSNPAVPTGVKNAPATVSVAGAFCFATRGFTFVGSFSAVCAGIDLFS
jgi:hypothetical protein